MKRFIFNLLFLIWHGFLFSQTNITVTLDKSSILTINGSTNLLTFKLNQYGEQIMGKPVTLTATQRGAKIYLSPNKLSITVVNFKSDNFMAQSEFYKLMKADIYPQLNIQLNYFEISSFDKQQISNSVASVNIKIAGVAKHYNIPIISTINRNTVAVNGEKKMTIKDFDLEPPVSMLGLIKVSEWIEIKFKIRCRLTIVQDSLAHQ